MTVESARPTPDESDGETTPLRATLEVTPDDGSCHVVSTVPNATAVKRSVSQDNVCHSAVTVEESNGSEHRYVSERMEDDCICSTLSQFDCVFDIEGTTDGSLLVYLVVEDRELVSRVVGALERRGTTVRLRRLSHLPTDEDATLEIDAANVTEKQREAVDLAVELGYYGRPRDATLEDLADELGVSKSAVSQRLNAVEMTLIQSFSEQ